MHPDSNAHIQELQKSYEERAKKPAPRFEPILSVWSDEDAYASGEEVLVHYNISDRDDYEYPATFIDWAVFYEREPTPVAEGDGNALPGTYNRTLYGDSYHLFAFRGDDGQGLKDTQVLVLQTGEPTEPYPDAVRIQEMINTTLKYYGEWEPAPDEPVVEEVVEVVQDTGGLERVHLAPEYCFECVELLDPVGNQGDALMPLGARGCKGYTSGLNHQDCAWVNILPSAWGEEFRVTSEYVNGGQGSVDVDFMDSCRPHGISVSGDEFIDHSHQPDEVVGIIPEGARCMVAFELELPGLGGDLDGINAKFEWNERPEPYEEPWFHPTLMLGFLRAADSPYYDGVMMVADEESGCIGDAAVCAPADCPGLQTNQKGLGCAWFEVTPNMVGMRYSVISPGDLDAKYLAECAPDAEVLGGHADFGPETGFSPLGGSGVVIEEGVGCIYVADWAGQSTHVHFTVVSNP